MMPHRRTRFWAMFRSWQKIDRSSTPTSRAPRQRATPARGSCWPFNSVGWQPSNALFNSLEALLGDPMISTAFNREQPAEIEAFIQNSTVNADGAVDVSALTPTPDSDFMATETVERLVQGERTVGGGPRDGVYRFLAPDRSANNPDGDELNVDLSAEDYLDTGRWELVGSITARTSNDAESAASAFKNATGQSTGGILATNKVSTSARAYISVSDYTSNDGPQQIDKGDRVQDESDGDGKVYQYTGSRDVIELGTETFTGPWTEVSVSTTITADRGVTITADDSATISSDNSLKALSRTVNDGGLSVITDFVETLVNEYGYTSESGERDITAGAKVRIASTHTGGAQPGDVYIFRPADPNNNGNVNEDGQPELFTIDLEMVDYDNDSDWKRVDPLDIEAFIPAGINLNTSESDSKAVGGVIVLNDVRGEVVSFIDDTTIVATGGGVSLTATEEAIIVATNNSVATADGGSFFVKGGTTVAANVMIATNSVLSSANAYITDSTLGSEIVPIGGDVVIDADNTSIISASTVAETTAEGAGDSQALGITLAFNRMGVKSTLVDIISAIPIFDTSFAADEPTEVLAYISNSDVFTSGGVSITADLDAIIDSTVSNAVIASSVSLNDNTAVTAAPLVALNSMETRVEAFIDGQSTVLATGGDIIITARDLSSIDADVLAASVSIALGKAGELTFALGASIAQNEIQNDMQAFIRDSVVDATAGNLLISADEDATIESSTVAAAIALSVTVKVDPESVTFSGGGAFAFNAIEGKSNAFIETSTASARGDVTLTADNDSLISSLVAAAAGSVQVGLQGPARAVAIGVSTALNEIGADDPLEVLAYIKDSQVTAGQALALTATSSSLIDATVVAASVALAASAGARVCVRRCRGLLVQRDRNARQGLYRRRRGRGYPCR